MYSEHYDELLPQSSKWVDLTLDFSGDEDVYHCSVLRRDQGEYGYAMLDSLSKVKRTQIESPQDRVLLFESVNLTRNAHERKINFPTPARHGVNNVAYLDGHVRAVRPSPPNPTPLDP